MALRPRAFGSSSINHLTQSIMKYITQWVSILQAHLSCCTWRISPTRTFLFPTSYFSCRRFYEGRLSVIT
ncbi:hypothetical protein ACN42_g4248 [Penicillium freii]|uniref:Uncharacterized protein n=1 Tax=Penicillium freii TaxID=48697 RepID=A0A101MLQ1_PENFR|nr:hypothetical protein ACN42_g4248 [Penicillium freii]